MESLTRLRALSADGTSINPISGASQSALARLSQLEFLSLPTVEIASNHNLAATEGDLVSLTLTSPASWTVTDPAGSTVASGGGTSILFAAGDNGVYLVNVGGTPRLPVVVANAPPEVTVINSLTATEGDLLTDGELIDNSGLSTTDVAADERAILVSITDPFGVTTDITNAALRFDGVDDFVELDRDSVLGKQTENFTVAAWINPGNLSSRMPILGGFEQLGGSGGLAGWAFELTPNGGLQFSAFGSGAPFVSSVVAPNTWTHVAVTIQSDLTVRYYVNGVRVGGIGALNAPATPTGVPFTIGTIQGGVPGFFNGMIDDVAVFSRQLDDADIARLYAGADRHAEDTNLVGMWRFNEAVGVVARDASSSGYDGVLGGGDPAAAPTWNLDDANPSVTFTAVHDGTHRVTFKAVDDDGGFAIAETTLQVLNALPTAIINAPTLNTTAGTPVSFDGYDSSDPGPGDTLSYSWQVSSATGQIVTAANGPTFSFTPQYAGFYDVRLTATDPAGAANVSGVTRVQVAPQAVITAPTTGLAEGQLLEFAAAASTPVAPAAARQFAWEVLSQSSVVATASGEVLRFRPGRDGSYTVRLTITDSFGPGEAVSASSSTPVMITNAVPQLMTPATAFASEGLFVLDVAVSDPGVQDPVNLFINWGDGTPIEQLATTGAGLPSLPSHTYFEAGEYTVSVTALDDDNAFPPTQFTQLTVQNAAPRNVALTGSASVNDGQTANFTVSFDDFGTDTHTVEWDFGDGSDPITVSASAGVPLSRGHVFTASGRFQVKVTVTDSEGSSSVATREIQVVNASPQGLTLIASPLGGTLAAEFSGAAQGLLGGSAGSHLGLRRRRGNADYACRHHDGRLAEDVCVRWPTRLRDSRYVPGHPQRDRRRRRHDDPLGHRNRRSSVSVPGRFQQRRQGRWPGLPRLAGQLRHDCRGLASGRRF